MWTINSLLATAALRSSRHSIANLSALTLDQPVTSSVSISIASDRLRFTCRNNTDLVNCLERVALTAAKHLLRFRPISASPSRQNLPIESSTLDFAIIFCARESTTIQSVFLMFPQQTTLPIYSPIVHLPACRTYLPSRSDRVSG